MIEILRVIYSSSLLQMRQSFARATFRFVIVIQPIIFAFMTYMMYRGSGRENYLAYVVLGTGILSLWSAITFSSAGDIERERFMGTLEIITATPSNFQLIIFGKVIGNTILGLMSMVITFVFVAIAYQVQLTIEHPVIFISSLLVSLLSFMGISMLMATFFTLSRNARALMNVLEYPVFILCGVLFPIDILPLWTRPLSYILSPTWAVKILRESVLGIENNNLFMINVLILLAITGIYFIIASISFRKIDKQTRIKATLGVH